MIKVIHKGSFKNTESFLERNRRMSILGTLEYYGERGVEALREATPKDSGETADSWSYEIVRTDTGYQIFWRNSNKNKGINIAILIQYGHATRNGGYVQGRDFINPAIQPVFDEIAESAWKEVTR